MIDLGRGERVVVVLHGSPGAAEDFAPLARSLARSRRVLALDMPGYGGRAALRPFSIDGALAAIEDELAALGASRSAIVGFSGGAYRALAIALRARIEVTSIVCLGGLAGFPREAKAPLLALAREIRGGAFERSSFAARMLAPSHDAADARRVESWLDACSPDVLADEIAAMADAEDLAPRLGELGHTPILARVGELDQAAPVVLSEAIVRGAKNARLEIVAGKGHALLVEDADATIARVAAFLDVE